LRRLPSGIGLQGLRGAASRVPIDATAFPHRAEQYDFLILAQWEDHRIRAVYGPNHQRLTELKRRYDPTNVFRLNQNVIPAG
jgi:hypothetical protein